MLLPQTHPQFPFSIPPKTLNPVFPNPKPFPFPSLLRCRLITTRASSTVPDSAIRRIADKLRSLGFSPEQPPPNPPPPGKPESSLSASSPGEIFVPLPSQLPKHRVGHTLDTSWSSPEYPVPYPGGDGGFLARYSESRRRTREERLIRKERDRVKGAEERVPTLAELRLSAGELRRLRSEGLKLTKKLKVGKAGITEGIVNGVHERWTRSELVKIACEDLCRMNMKRTHDLLERKTGGLVVWRSGSVIILYRGADYKYPYFSADNVLSDNPKLQSSDGTFGKTNGDLPGSNEPEDVQPVVEEKARQLPPIVRGVGSPDKVRFQLPGESEIAEEDDRLLDGLGPRFTDWWGYEPLPVDADLLPAVVPGYRRPFRLLPYGVKPILTNDEMTTLRRLSRPLPCHFALGRNRNLEGLAACIVKLWEKCEIAKVAVKRGVQNTNSGMMAEQLKRLTGGTLLSGDKEYIVLYRGKDFLPCSVSSVIEERRNHQINGGKALNLQPDTSIYGLEATEQKESSNVSGQRNVPSTDDALVKTKEKLSAALAKKARAEKVLEELNNAWDPEPSDVDKEGITREERYMLRKIGLRMKPFLLLGRRSVFDGTIENMHLHWKYRELVKVICKDRDIETVHSVARTLESESGGILVAVERVSKGHAIIVYRGKNYQRPASIRPDTLLSKREAMRRSKEAQRRESLKLHVLKLSDNIKEMELQLVRDGRTNSMHSSDKSSPEVAADAERESVQTSDEGIPGPHEKLMEEGSNHEVGDNTTIPSYGTSQHALQSQQEEDQLIEVSARIGDRGSSEMNAQVSYEPVIEVSEQDVSLNKDVAGGIMSPSVSVSTRRRFNATDMEDDLGEAAEFSESRDNLGRLIGLTKTTKRSTLSNKERLVLRKQALGMRKRPMVAIGRSNVLTGIAKTIKLHFEKHPLVIVNVKGRAEGTSVRELVFRLEQVTGATLVSQETNKIILYRGWGAEEGVGDTKGRARGGSGQRWDDLGRQRYPVSPDLLAAVRFECGLFSNHAEQGAM